MMAFGIQSVLPESRCVAVPLVWASGGTECWASAVTSPDVSEEEQPDSRRAAIGPLEGGGRGIGMGTGGWTGGGVTLRRRACC